MNKLNNQSTGQFLRDASQQFLQTFVSLLRWLLQLPLPALLLACLMGALILSLLPMALTLFLLFLLCKLVLLLVVPSAEQSDKQEH